MRHMEIKHIQLPKLDLINNLNIMKPIRILFVVSVLTGVVMLSSPCFAQLSLREVISRTPTQSVPFDATKNTWPSSEYGYGVINPNNIIPDRLYDNVQLTKYDNASVSPDLGASFFRKFTIPNSTNKLIAVSFGGVTDWRTDVLCTTTSSGQVLNTIEGTVMFYPYIAIKQFRINSQNQIIITTIKPTSTTSIPLSDFTSFTGYRQDITYKVSAQGLFEQVSVQKYRPKTYTRSYLENKSINLWQGNEIPE